jgi:LysM repeat protein
VLVVPIGSLARRDANATAIAMASVEKQLREAEAKPAAKRSRAKVASSSKKTARSASTIAASAREDSKSRATIKVRKGDTLWSIAKRFDVAVEELARWNGIRRPATHKLKAGHTLIVYPNTGSNRVRPVASAP